MPCQIYQIRLPTAPPHPRSFLQLFQLSECSLQSSRHDWHSATVRLLLIWVGSVYYSVPKLQRLMTRACPDLFSRTLDSLTLELDEFHLGVHTKGSQHGFPNRSRIFPARVG